MSKNDECTMEMVLQSMADSLMNVEHLFVVPYHEEIEPVCKVGGRPPREVFYRNTLTFATKIPLAVSARRCTSQYVCHGAKATIKCMSCALYDPNGVGFFCELCFKAQHPWYRVPHVYMSINNEESVKHQLKVAHRIAEVTRYERESQDVLKKVENMKPNLTFVADDIQVEANIQVAGHKILNLEDKMREIRTGIRHEIRESAHTDILNGNHVRKALNVLKKLTSFDAEAIVSIQKTFRGYRLRKSISLSFIERLVRIWDPNQANEFFYDKVTSASSVTPTPLLMKMHWDKLQYVELPKEENVKPIWYCKRRCPRRRSDVCESFDVHRAVSVIQGFMRCIKARHRILFEADLNFRSILDKESGKMFYVNVVTNVR